jgi:hypothetical protein
MSCRILSAKFVCFTSVDSAIHDELVKMTCLILALSRSADRQLTPAILISNGVGFFLPSPAHKSADYQR